MVISAFAEPSGGLPPPLGGLHPPNLVEDTTPAGGAGRWDACRLTWGALMMDFAPRGGSGRAKSTPLIFTMPGDGPSLRCFRAAPARAGRNEGRAKTVRRVGLHHWAFCVLCALTGPAAMRSAPWNTLGASRGTAIGRERGTTQPQKLAAFAAVVSHPGRASAIVCVCARSALLEYKSAD